MIDDQLVQIVLRELPDRLRETAITPAHRHYESVRHTYSYRGSPALVLRPSTSEDVAASIRSARAHDLDPSIRSGGHGISSRSTNDGGLVIDLGAMAAVRVTDAEAGVVRLQPGARWGDVASSLQPSGLALTSGDSGDVGVGGLATTGGIGLLGRRQGLTIDRVRSATIVTADGRVVYADADSEPDLFWAVRGAGANVGIVTEFEMVAERVPGVAEASIQYMTDDAAGFMAAWAAVVEGSPREVTAFLYAFPQGGRTAFITTVVVITEDGGLAERLLQPFGNLGHITAQQAHLGTYASVVRRSNAPHSGAASWYTRSSLIATVDTSRATALAGVLSSGAAHTLQLRATGGAVNDVPASATAYAHRHQSFAVMAGGPDSRLDASWGAVERLSDGLYLSFDNSGHQRLLTQAFPEDTLRRLRAVKDAWDPDDVFRHNFSIGSVNRPG